MSVNPEIHFKLMVLDFALSSFLSILGLRWRLGCGEHIPRVAHGPVAAQADVEHGVIDGVVYRALQKLCTWSRRRLFSLEKQQESG